jgi:glycosyltransferase involved in cell wall biosynthesis
VPDPHIRIHYIHDGPVPSLAANAVQVTKMCAAFQANGAAVTLTVPSGRAGTRDEIARHYRLSSNVAIRRLPNLHIPGCQLIFGGMAVLGSWSSGTIVFTRSISVGLISTLLGVPTALEMHMPVSTMRPVMADRLRRMITRQSFLMLVVISERLRREFEAMFPELGDRILVAHDGADPVERAVLDPVTLQGTFRVGYIGHLYAGKGMELIEQLAPLRPHMTFHIVGGRDADLEHWRERTAGTPNIVYHGHVPHSETRRYLASMDVVLAPYQRVVRGSGGGASNLADWMSPLKMFEYMAEGKAILSSDLPVLREVLFDGRNALLRPPEDVPGWADALSALESDAALRCRLGQQGRQDLLEHYTWDRRARAILTALSTAATAGYARSGAVSDVRPALDLELLRAAPQTFSNDNAGGKRHERPHCDDDKGRAEH